jgi:hypothetical protein
MPGTARMEAMMSDPTPEILPLETEREILFNYLIDAMRGGKLALRQDLTVAEGWETIAGMAVTGVLRRLRVMSARQLAVLLAAEANGGEGWVIHEPPRYTAAEIAEAE